MKSDLVNVFTFPLQVEKMGVSLLLGYAHEFPKL
jgi:hypothetical protein